MAKPRICSVVGCDKPHHRKGLCSAHSKRMMRHGTLATIQCPPGEQLQWLRDHTGHTDVQCLTWPYRTNDRGRAVVSFLGKPAYAATVMCTMVNGERPSVRHEAAHSCGKGHLGCVNPVHLRWATREENKADMLVHGTHFRGENSPNHKLTERQARTIKASFGIKTSPVLAKEFNVSKSTIKAIWTGRIWGWL